MQIISEDGVTETKDTPTASRHMAVLNETEIWFGCTNGKIHHINGTELNHHTHEVTAIAVSPDGAYLASGDSNRYVLLWNAKDNTLLFDNWVYHTSRVTCMDWSPDSSRLLSGGIDCTLIIWDVDGSSRKLIDRAHPGQIRAVKYLGDNKIASAGGDNTVKIWQLN